VLLWTGMLLATGLAVPIALAQPANDSFGAAEEIFGVWGTVTNDTTLATGEPAEPSHGGFPAFATIWYKWLAPQDGEVQLDTLSGTNDTVVAVYTGATLNTLRQVAANDDLFPFVQQNISGSSFITQPFNGPSGLRFNAKAGTTYYFAVASKFAPGFIALGWAYHASGVFRFATEEVVSIFRINTNGPFPTFEFVQTPVIRASENESFAIEDAATVQTYYQFGVPGVLVTVTRLAGSSGRMLVDYATEDVLPDNTVPGDLPAIAFQDYSPVQGTLVFDDHEMTKRIVIPIQSDFGMAQSNRNFAVILTNARPDIAETPNVSPPRVDGGYGRVIVRILDADIDPILSRNFQVDTNISEQPFFATPTNAVFNFARSAYRTVEDVNGYWSEVDIWIDRTGTNRDSVTLHYRIDNFLGGGDNADPSELDNNYFPLQPGSDYATPTPADDANGNTPTGIHGTNPDFVLEGVPRNNYSFPGGGTITFPGGNRFNESRSLTLRVTNDFLTEFNEDFRIFLYANRNDIEGDLVGTISEATLTILFDDQDPPAGSVDQYHNPDFGVSMVPPITTTPPNMAHPGADSVVYGMSVLADNRTVIAGDFLSYNATARGRIARLNVNGSLDTTFTPGSGANDFIGALARNTAGQFIIGGGFTSYNGVPRPRVARINANGTLDPSYSSGLGPNASVWAVAVQPDGKAIIAGEFTSVNGSTRYRVARLDANGSLDTTFDPGLSGPDGTIWALALQPDGKVIIGGEFVMVGGEFRGGIARLNEDGTPDPSFNSGSGTDGIVYALALQGDGKVLVGGEFSQMDFNPRNNLTRLNADGSLDATFDPGSRGSDRVVYSIVTGGGGIYVGGAFDKYNGTHRRSIVRLFPDGTVDTGFLDTAYNQFAGLHRARFSDQPGIVYALGVQSDGNLMIGGSFQQVGGGQADIQVRPETADPNLWTEPKARDGVRNRNNVARLLGGATPGPGNISLTSNNHIANENQSFLSVGLTRENGTLGFLSANFEVEEGLVQSGVDYIYNAIPPIYLSSWRLFTATPSEPNSTTRMHSDGLFGDSLIPQDIYGSFWFGYTPGELNITILNDFVTQGDRNTTFRLSNPTGADLFYLGGENIPLGGALGFSQSPFSIVDDDQQKGVLGFSTVNFVVNENIVNAVVTVIRTNGSSGSVSVQYATVTGGTAAPGVDYTTRSGTLTFNNGQTNRTFTIPISDDTSVEPDETIFVRLSGAGGGATIGLTNAVVTIVDNDTPGGKLNFSSPTFSTNENATAATITVTRSGSAAGTLTVFAAATNGTAINGLDFVGVTNLLSWTNNEVAAKTFTVTLLDDVTVEPNETVTLRLFDPTLNGLPSLQQLGPNSNAVLTIVENDAPGLVSFSASNYNVNENGGAAIISVVRVGGGAETVSVNFAAVAGTAVNGVDFISTNGTLIFAPGELSKSFAVPIINNGLPDSARFISLSLANAVPSGSLGSPSAAIINLIDDESVNEPSGGLDTLFVPSGMNDAVLALALQGDGKLIAAGDFTVANLVPKLRIVRLNPLNGSVDDTFTASANATIQTLAHQSDGRTVIGGAFTTVNGVVRNRIARLSSNGALDTVFNPGSGTDNPVFAVAEAFVNGDRKILIGGAFTTYNGAARNRIARLNNDGSLDAGFDPGTGADGIVYALTSYPTNTPDAGKIIIVGDFTAVNGVGSSRIARLNSDGSVDVSFDPGTGADSAIRAVALQADGRILIGGSFTNFNGTVINRIARLNANGSIDPTFTPGEGADDVVNSITVQSDTRIVLGGQFSHCNGVTRNRITRLNSNGTADGTINFGSGANNFVAATLVQPDDKIVIGGGFTEYDGVARQRIARIYGRSLAGSGTLEFNSASYQVSESATNATITVRRYGGTAGLTPGASISVDVVTSNGTATNGIHYTGGTNTLVFAEGEVFQTFTIPVIDNFEINPARTVNLTLGNILPPGSASIGNQPTATLTILDDDTGISFSSATFTRNENSPDGQATITIVRTGSVAAPATVNFTTTTNGTATAGLDFTPVTNLVSFAIGETIRTVTIPIINDLVIEGNQTVTMELTNAIGGLLIAPTIATLTIVDDDIGPGQIAFAALAYAGAENGGTAIITLARTNGNSGVVGVTFKTSDFTAVAGFDYTAVNTSVTFSDGETTKNILVPVLDDAFVEGNEIFHVTLTNATGGATITEPATVPVTILDNDMGLSFSSPFYSVDESGPSVTLTVLRLGGSNGVSTVRYDSTNLTATAGSDFGGVANGLLTFANGETIKTFTIPILEDSQVEGDEAFGVNLSNPSSGLQLLISSTIVSILDNDTGFSLSTNSYVIDEGATNVMITVFRTNANTGPASVSLTTSDSTALAGADYTPFGNSLNFTNGEAMKIVLIPINNDTVVEGAESFDLTLTGPSPGAQIVGTSSATVTIIDNDAGLQFSSANYTVPETGVAATITVVRTGITTNTVAVNYATSDGTAANGADYTASSGLLVFTNGEISKTFNLQIIDDTIEEGAETILLSLSSPTGQVSLLNPNAATLTIVDDDGGSILPAGTLLTAENGTPNSAIDPAETVTVLFGLRNASGVNTTNLVATLLATNGVVAPSGAQNYGALINNGASVSRPFSFTANGTNGGFITATFQVQDGSSSYGRVTFTFLLGSRTTVFSNTAPITIVDLAPASPYPSSITVTGLVGSITKLTATVTNLSHGSPDDVDMLLVGPTGTSTVLMSDAGGFNMITNVTLTFDDAAAASLPDSSLIVSGTNKPTNFLVDSFASPAPSGPWGSTLGTFTDSNPNGLWSLYVVDDLQIFGGSIGGWSVAITTLGTLPATADLSVKMTATPNPVVVGNNLTYVIVVTNHGPWTATGVKLTNTIPAGATFVSATPSVGTISTNSGAVVWTIGSMLKDAGVTATVVIRPGTLGAAVSSSSAFAVESDPNPINSIASTTNTVIAPIADLVVDVVSTPNPVFITTNNNLTYTITVNNLGPATAIGVGVTNTLPGEVSFLSATPSGYTLAGGVVTFTNLGNLASGAQTVATIVVRAVTPATLTNNTTVGSSVTDPLKGNNTVSVKTIVEFPQVGLIRSGNNLVISWPAGATAYSLDRTFSLTPPIIWTPVTTPASVTVGDQQTITLPIGSGSEFFRLRAVAP
jgi:uncharacterized repeat protein (TIGR01451 family)/uncharacterized delta-60 repeat protein